MIAPARPDRAVRTQCGPAPAGARRQRPHTLAPRRATRSGLRSWTSAARSPSSEVHLRRNALARGLAAEGIREGDSIAIMCRNHRGFIEATIACSKLGADAPLPEHRVRRSADRGRDAAREPQGADLRRGVRRPGRARAAQGRTRFVAWCDARREPARTRRWSRLIAAAADVDLTPPAEKGPRRDPHLRHDRHAKGRGTQTARLARARRGAVLEDPAEGAARRR